MRQSTRAERAKSLADDLRRQAESVPPPAGGGGLSEEVARSLVAHFQAAPASNRPGVAATHGRGDQDYWTDHGLLTGDLMAEIARWAEADVDLYRRVGQVHDIDYLAYPHDGKGPGDRHPLPLVTAMREAGIHPAICLAVLEHTPYAGFDERPSSRLSAALSAAEDMATLAALPHASEAVGRLSDQAVELFRKATPRRFIPPGSTLRVETDVERFINRPLALALGDGRFELEV